MAKFLQNIMPLQIKLFISEHGKQKKIILQNKNFLHIFKIIHIFKKSTRIELFNDNKCSFDNIKNNS